MKSFNIRVIILSFLAGNLGLVHAASMRPIPKKRTETNRVFSRGIHLSVVDEGFPSPSPTLSNFEEAAYGMKDPAVNSPLPKEYESLFKEEHCFEEQEMFFISDEKASLPVDLGSALKDCCNQDDSSCNQQVICRILSYLIKQQTNRTLTDAGGRTLLDLCKLCGYRDGVIQLLEEEDGAVDSTAVAERDADVVPLPESATRAASAFEPILHQSSSHASVRAESSTTSLDSEEDQPAMLPNFGMRSTSQPVPETPEQVKDSAKQRAVAAHTKDIILERQNKREQAAIMNELVIKHLKEKLEDRDHAVDSLKEYCKTLEATLVLKQCTIDALRLEIEKQGNSNSVVVSAATSGITSSSGAATAPAVASSAAAQASAPTADTTQIVIIDAPAFEQGSGAHKLPAVVEDTVVSALTVAQPTTPQKTANA